MTRRFPIKEISRQSGLSTATVDRVLNNRANVSPQTRNRVAKALRELKSQEAQLSSTGAHYFFDIIAETPLRFSREIQNAAHIASGSVPGAAIRLRFLFQEIMTEDETLMALARVIKKGSHGICLKARDTPGLRAAIADLANARIPVFTLVTDIPGSARQGYFGLDNAQAGRTAAYLLAQSLPDQDQEATILTSRSQADFQGETDRFIAFRDLITALKPNVRLMDVSGGAGVTAQTGSRIDAALEGGTRIAAVYSMGGGNAEILRILALRGQNPRAFVAHDLDRENTRLLAAGAIGYVLHHDLSKDFNTLFKTALTDFVPDINDMCGSSDIQIVTPFNLSYAIQHPKF